jgi:gliding motility-associated-like protein
LNDKNISIIIHSSHFNNILSSNILDTKILIIMRLLTILFLTLLTSIGYTQHCPELGPDQLLPCGIGTTTLTADLSQCGGGGANPNQTTNYGVTNIPYVAQTNTGTSLFMTDDSQQGPFSIGFNFCFFGTTYTQFYVGSNGWISFTGGQPTTFTSQPIPTANPLVPKNCIMGPWQDWHPGIGGQIKYQVQGVAPCRKLTVSWINMPLFSCTGNQGTFHIVIYESSNYIENYIQSKPACLQWQGGTATQGIHNLAGTVGIAVAGRNSTAWTANNDAYRWTPSGPVVTPTLTWYQVGNPNPIGTGPTLTVTPPAGGAQYTCHFVYPICNAGWTNCNLNANNLGPDTVFVAPGPPNLPPPTITTFNPNCVGSCDGAINVLSNGGTGVQTISWNGQPPSFTLLNLCAGVYSFTIVDAAGCNISGTATLINPLPVIANPIIASDTVCYQSNNMVYTTTDLGFGYTYQWTSVGNIVSGQGTNTIIVDWTGFPAGFIPNAVDVVAINPSGCLSVPVSFDITIFNVLPVITPVGPFCSNDEFTTLDATPIGGVFSGTGVMGNDFYPSNADTLNNIITYTYTQSGCVFDTTTDIIVYEQPILSQITPYNEFFEICDGDSIPSVYSVTSTVSGGYNEWTLVGNTTQSTNFNIAWNTFGTFVLSVVNYVNGCTSPQEQTTITIAQCPQELLYIPNSFTPDGNEFNNTWKPIVTSGFDNTSYRMTLYNRWGEVIWESRDINEGWDGTFNNSIVPVGSYVWTVELKALKTDYRQIVSGSVNVLK